MSLEQPHRVLADIHGALARPDEMADVNLIPNAHILNAIQGPEERAQFKHGRNSLR